MFSESGLEEAITLVGDVLADRGHQVDVVAIGGGGLLLIGMIDRPTKDLDLIARVDDGVLIPLVETLPAELAEAVTDVARNLDLDPRWVDVRGANLMRFGLPIGFESRVDIRSYGGLRLRLASRFDQIHFKLFAAADDKPHGKHHVDLQKLKPTRDELISAARWAKTHDSSEGFAAIVNGVLESFGVTDGKP